MSAATPCTSTANRRVQHVVTPQTHSRFTRISAGSLGHAILLILCVAFTSNAVWAAPLIPIALPPSADLEQVRATVHRGGAVVRRGTAVAGPRGNVAVRRTTVVRPGG